MVSSFANQEGALARRATCRCRVLDKFEDEILQIQNRKTRRIVILLLT